MHALCLAATLCALTAQAQSTATAVAPATPLPLNAAGKTAKPNFNLKDLSLAEKTGQLVMITMDSANADKYRQAIENGLVGGVLLQWGDYSLAETAILTNKLQQWAAASRSRIPLLIAADYEGGSVYAPSTLGLPSLPTNMMIGAAREERDTATLFYLAGINLRHAGITVSFAPVLDINTNANNPAIGVRSFGSDPAWAITLGRAALNGLTAAGTLPVPKHFPGQGAAGADSHELMPIIPLTKEELKPHLAPFEMAVRNKCGGIMTAHILYPDLDQDNAATFSPKLLEFTLRGDMGYTGLIFTDSLDMKGALEQGKTVPQAAVKAFLAGADILLAGPATPPEAINAAIMEAMGNGLKTRRIDDAAARILAAKQKLYEQQNPLTAGNFTTDQAFNTISGNIAGKAVTIIRDKAYLVPVPPVKGQKTSGLCAVFFAPPRFADDLIAFQGPFLKDNWQVRQYNAPITPSRADEEEASRCVTESDVAVIGSFQWADKPNTAQLRLVKKLLQAGKPAILLSLMSPYDIRHYPEAKTVLATYGITRHSLLGAANVLQGFAKAQGIFPLDKTVLAPVPAPRRKPARKKTGAVATPEEKPAPIKKLVVED